MRNGRTILFVLALALTSVASAQEPAATLTGHKNAVAVAAYSPDGRLLVTGSFDQTVTVWDAANGAALRTFAGHEGQVLAVAITPDGRRLISGSRDKTLKVWDAFIPTPVARLAGHAGPVTAVTTAGDGAWLATGTHG